MPLLPVPPTPPPSLSDNNLKELVALLNMIYQRHTHISTHDFPYFVATARIFLRTILACKSILFCIFNCCCIIKNFDMLNNALL